MPDFGPPSRYAAVYDIIYGSTDASLDAEMGYLQPWLAGVGGLILDAGCGTGRHLLPLCRQGFAVLGLDIEPAMLAVARMRLRDSGLTAPLVVGDLAALPFDLGFDAVLCLDSPLALLDGDAALHAALRGFRRALGSSGVLIAEVFDYLGTLGHTGYGPQRTLFATTWGIVEVVETHRHLRRTGVWTMRQDFTVIRSGKTDRFTVSHRFRLRSADGYAAALEEAGFAIVELLPAYPGTPPQLRHEQRMIFVAKPAARSP